MKLSVNSFRNVLLPLLTSLFFWSCTLIDNDLRGLPDYSPAYKQIVHEETDEYTADYQYQPWTILVDERYEPYIYAIDYEHDVLYLYDYIPEELLPEEGNALAAKPSDKLDFGLSYKVMGVLHYDNLYAVVMQRAFTEDIFKYLELSVDTEYGTEVVDDVDEEGNPTRSIQFVRTKKSSETRGDDDLIDEDNPDIVIKRGKWTFDIVDIASSLLTDGHAVMKTAILNGVKMNDKVHEFHWVPRDASDWKSFVDELKKNEKGDVPKKGESEKETVKKDGKDVKVGEKIKNTGGKALDRLKDAAYFEAQGFLKWIVEIEPKVKIRVYHNQQEKKIDYSYTICGTFGMDFGIGGSVTLILDWLKILGWDKNFERFIGSVAGVPIWFQLNPQLWSVVDVGGSFSYDMKKYFEVGLGYKDGYGKDDGFYKIDKDKPLEIKEKEKWEVTDEDLARFGTSAEIHCTIDFLKFTPQMILGIGIPPKSMISSKENKLVIDKLPEKVQEFIKDVLEGNASSGINVKIEWDPYISARLNINANAGVKRPGQGHFHFCVPISLRDGYIVLTPFPGYEFRWNFLDKLLSLFGGDNIGYWEFWVKDWVKYPAIDNVSIVCDVENNTESPIFTLDFNVTDLGMGYESKKGQFSIPVVYDYDKSDKERKNPLFRWPFDYLTVQDIGKHFVCKISDPRIKKDKEYVLKINMMTWTGEDIKNTQYYEEHIFSSASPSAYITRSDVYYREAIYPQNQLAWYGQRWKTQELTDKEYAKWYPFKFRTKVSLVSSEDITELGFFVGSKEQKHVVKEKIAPGVKEVNALWNFPDNMQKKRNFEIIPYVKVKKSSMIQRWHSPHIVEFNYESKARDPNWGGKGVPYKWIEGGEKYGQQTYVSYGLDETENYTKDGNVVNVVESSTRAAASTREDGRYVGEIDGVPTYEFTINSKDLE